MPKKWRVGDVVCSCTSKGPFVRGTMCTSVKFPGMGHWTLVLTPSVDKLPLAAGGPTLKTLTFNLIIPKRGPNFQKWG